jgi:hypothetical protein
VLGYVFYNNLLKSFDQNYGRLWITQNQKTQNTIRYEILVLGFVLINTKIYKSRFEIMNQFFGFELCTVVHNMGQMITIYIKIFINYFKTHNQTQGLRKKLEIANL